MPILVLREEVHLFRKEPKRLKIEFDGLIYFQRVLCGERREVARTDILPRQTKSHECFAFQGRPVYNI